MKLTANLVWCETLEQLDQECVLVNGDKILCVDEDGVVRRLTWDEDRKVLTNTKGVEFDPEIFVEFCTGEALENR